MTFHINVLIRNASPSFSGVEQARSRLKRVSNVAPLAATQREKVMRHFVITGMDDFVVHRKHEDIMKITLHSPFEIGHGFAVNVSLFAER